MHLNKSEYNKGEEVWFKGYLYDANKNKLSIGMDNLYCGIYDSIGNLKSKKMFLVKDGETKGSFAIDESFFKGEYYIKAYTNRILSINDNKTYIQKIRITDSSLKKNKEKDKKERYDFQVLPEGGHMISGVKNSIGFIVVNNKGQGVKIDKGRILDNNDNEVLTFKGNGKGLGKFEFTPLINMNYKINAIVNNFRDTISVFPKIDNKGIALSVNNTNSSDLIVFLRKNSDNYNSNKKIKILVHRDGLIAYENVFYFNGENNIKTIKINRDKLLRGVNILTFFYDGKPILERLFFNKEINYGGKINVKEFVKNNDSTSVKIGISNNSNNVSLSVSVLPLKELETYDRNNNIVSEFYLKPYIRGSVVDSYSYFDNNNKDRFKELDLLLLTQGWSSYNWEDIFNRKGENKSLPKEEKGITILGRVAKVDKNKILLYGIGHTLDKRVNFKSGNGFIMSNLNLFEGDNLRFSYFDKKTGSYSAPIVYLKYSTQIIEDKINTSRYEKLFFEKSDSFIYEKVLGENEKYQLGTVLEEVEVKTKKERVNNIDKTKPNYATSSTKKHEITEEVKNTFGTIPNFLRSLGFIVNEISMDGSLELKVKVRETLTFKGKQTPAIWVDGVRMDQNDLSYLYNMSLDEIDEIYYDRHGSGYGVGGTFGVVTINTKKNFKREEVPPYYLDKEAKVVFTRAKKYYTPIYYLKTGNIKVIDWKPDVFIKRGTDETLFNLSSEIREKVIYIEGIDDKGNLYSKEVLVR